MKTTKRKLAFLLCLMLLVMIITPLSIYAVKTESKVVRVGWYESPFNKTDQFGRRSGYAYEYQRKIASYTGWKYEYVEGSWPDLMQMLANGEIDLMSDVSYTEERAQNMLFPDLPMGSEEYYLFVSKSNTQISQDDYTTLNGKKVGVNKGSVQIKFLKEWAQMHGITVNIVELSNSVSDSLKMLYDGKIDAYLTLDSYSDPDTNIPICAIGSSDFFFAVNKDRRDLLNDLNMALNRIDEENRFYNAEMYEKYNRTNGASFSLTAEETAWLDDHGAIRVGYQDNYLAFCASDKSGNLTGALKDYLEFISTSLGTNISFVPVAYPTAAAAVDAMKNGEVDCVFPANLTDYDAEIMGLTVSPAIMKSEMYAVVRMTEQRSFVYKEDVTVAVNQGNPNYDFFLADHFPDWNIKYYEDSPACLKAIAAGEADCLLISNYRYNNISKQCEKLHLTTVSTGVSMDYCFAFPEGETKLYSIMSRAEASTPSSVLNAALTYYSAEDAKPGFIDFINDNIIAVMAIVTLIALVITMLILKSMSAEHKAIEGQQLISATETDALTGLYIQNFFYEYANRIYNDNPEKPMDAVVIDIEQFQLLNESNGHDFADQVLKTLGENIQEFLSTSEGIGGRFEADQFNIFCEPQNSYQDLLNRFQSNLNKLSDNVNIRLRMGVMPARQDMEPARLFTRARAACNSIRNHESRIKIYDEIMEQQESLNQRLLSDLWRSLNEHDFKVYYQPKYDIQNTPPRLVSAEALVRWQHPELGMVSPAVFIPLFEETGDIYEIDKYVWRETVRQITEWREKYGITLPISVNLSRIDVLNPTLEQTLDEILKEFNLEPKFLKLEITESAYIKNTDLLNDIILRLRAKGHEIEMDDFGTGYSSLNMLSSIPIDVLKMDMAFVRNIAHSEKDMRLVELILDIAKNLQISVIAEGVETEAQMTILKQAGCQMVQGNYFSRPVAPDKFEKFIG